MGKAIVNMWNLIMDHNVNPLNKTGVNSFKPMLKPVYFDSLGINLTGAKLITFEKDYVMYEGLFNYKEIEFSITLCAQYWEEHKFLGNLVGFNYANGFGNIEKLKKYGIGWCGNTIGFVGHWDGDETIKTETEFKFPKALCAEPAYPEKIKIFNLFITII